MYLRAFKNEKIIEIWAKDESVFQLIQTYNICKISGDLGSKKREGDLQTPEGFYEISNFNPTSKFHLSLKINYPNAADKIRNKNEKNIGGDIYIHGNCVTIGCLPITDQKIEELYWLCTKYYSVKKENIPIHIFPFKMTKENITLKKQTYKDEILWQQWNQLLPMYRFFESHHLLGEVTSVDDLGNYKLSIPWD